MITVDFFIHGAVFGSLCQAIVFRLLKSYYVDPKHSTDSERSSVFKPIAPFLFMIIAVDILV